MGIEKLMSKAIVTVQMDDTLKHIKKLFDHTGFHHLLVVESNELVGVISDRDLLKSLSPNLGTASETAKDLAVLNKRVHQIMSRKLVTLTSEASVYDAIDVFNQYKISCIPIVDQSKKAVGILSWRDIMLALKRKNQ
ncbi:CBS domain-containing protein [Thalassotalea sp. G2M2-11]|uniref:CBS domain-containing protein n=1 Tax=Thalassotalea sp. G2M2-11 TaxID=2787627 RepID=UPI0019D0C0E1|nr:CBS domain-containing protein [Thalassotalea sp. G2M2-11]